MEQMSDSGSMSTSDQDVPYNQAISLEESLFAHFWICGQSLIKSYCGIKSLIRVLGPPTTGQ